MPEVTLDDFARSFGVSPEEFSDTCRKVIPGHDFRYERLPRKQRDDVILSVLKKIATDTQKIGTEERAGVWENGWAENLLPRLQQLEREGKAKILAVKRLYFGSLFMEGYTYIVW